MRTVSVSPPEFRWVYTPVGSYTAARDWAKGTLTIIDDAPDDEEYIQTLHQVRLPYEPLPEHKQHFGCHLLLRPSGTHTFFTHGIHSILDGRPNLVLLRRIFEMVANPEIACEWSLAPGSDVSNLPLDAVHAIGEERFEQASCEPFETPEEIKGNPVRIEILFPTI